MMKWDKSELIHLDGQMDWEDELIIDSDSITLSYLKSCEEMVVRGSFIPVVHTHSFLCRLHIEGVYVCPCAISNVDVEVDCNISEEYMFSFDEVDDEETIIIKGEQLDLEPLIRELILNEAPLKVVDEGLEEYPQGDGWRIFKEGDYDQQKEGDPRLSILKNFKAEEE